MAVFSSAQADASKIVQADKEYAGSTFKAWAFQIVDENNNVYEWEDTSENLLNSSTVTIAQVSTYIKAYLTGGSKADVSGSYAGVERAIGLHKKRSVIGNVELRGIAPGATPPTMEHDIIDPIVSSTGEDDVATSESEGQSKTFTASDATPSVKGTNIWDTHTGTLTITDFDNGDKSQTIYVRSKGAITFDVTSTNLKGGSTDIVTADGDLTVWWYDGTSWWLMSFLDISANLTGGH